eukprot:gnl/MRDRNA2_/MRDRNA2_162996_c0_seq1.p1 gnl/MRDRNA2_/MRDRNA2_162996_c0~~gnl/MRDRNA2_/MRDRNA2_162996_c0_seq1.p1  ORF type:complete len:168 (-),score=30.95 gnl/MRDRNA2_/MRDRNA2_162996_c0_seq1:36-539(-)
MGGTLGQTCHGSHHWSHCCARNPACNEDVNSCSITWITELEDTQGRAVVQDISLQERPDQYAYALNNEACDSAALKDGHREQQVEFVVPLWNSDLKAAVPTKLQRNVRTGTHESGSIGGCLAPAAEAPALGSRELDEDDSDAAVECQTATNFGFRAWTGRNVYAWKS